ALQSNGEPDGLLAGLLQHHRHLPAAAAVPACHSDRPGHPRARNLRIAVEMGFPVYPDDYIRSADSMAVVLSSMGGLAGYTAACLRTPPNQRQSWYALVLARQVARLTHSKCLMLWIESQASRLPVETSVHECFRRLLTGDNPGLTINGEEEECH